MKRPVSELEGAELDFWVGRSLGYDFRNWEVCIAQFSSDWGRGGTIIEDEEIELAISDSKEWFAEIHLYADGRKAYRTSFDRVVIQKGKNPLIAAMRCFVASKFGEFVGDEE